MKKILILFVIIIAGLLFGCEAFLSSQVEVSASPVPTADTINTIDPEEITEDSVQIKGDSMQIANVYFQIFCDLTRNSELDDLKYISLDLSGVRFYRKDLIINIFEEYCKDNGISLLVYTYEELDENGYLVNGIGMGGWFKDGIVIGFYDIELNDALLVISATEIRGYLTGFDITYTAEKKGDNWIIEAGEKNCI